MPEAGTGNSEFENREPRIENRESAEAQPAQKRKKTFADFLPIFWMCAVFIVSQVLALIVMPTFSAAGMQAFENPSDPKNSLVYILIILGFTALILLIARFKLQRLIKYIILGAMFFTMYYVFWPLLIMIPAMQAPVFGIFTVAKIISIAASALLIAALYRHPEWYVVDTCGILVSAGAIAIFGISFDIIPALFLLAGLAVYDFISVYRTKHMLKLADSVLDLKLPMMIIVPRRAGYSFIEDSKSVSERQEQDKEERDAMFMGLGDIVIPGVLVGAAYHFVGAAHGAQSGALLAAAVLLGALAGFVALMFFVMKGKAQAGLPFLNGGAILGYVIGSLAIFGTIVL